MHICKPSEALCLWKRRRKERVSEEKRREDARRTAYGGERKRYLRITWKRDGDRERERGKAARNSGRKKEGERAKEERERKDYRGRWLERRRERESDDKEGERVERSEERRASEVETRGSCLAPGSPCSLKQSRRMPPTLADLLCHSETCIPGAGFLSLSYS